MDSKRRNFEEWLIDNHSHRDTPRGDLAREVVRDPRWPGNGDYGEMKRRLVERGLPADTLRELRSAWRSYRDEDMWELIDAVRRLQLPVDSLRGTVAATYDQLKELRQPRRKPAPAADKQRRGEPGLNRQVD